MKAPRALQLATYAAASRSAAAWARRQRERLRAAERAFHARDADLDDASPMWPYLLLAGGVSLLPLAIFLLIKFGWALARLGH